MFTRRREGLKSPEAAGIHKEGSPAQHDLLHRASAVRYNFNKINSRFFVAEIKFEAFVLHLILFYTGYLPSQHIKHINTRMFLRNEMHVDEKRSASRVRK